MTSAKCYGGPYHGKVIPRDRVRFVVEDISFIEKDSLRSRPPEVFIRQPSNYCTYSLRRYETVKVCPKRVREIAVFVFDGEELLPREEIELEREVYKRRSKVLLPESFLYDFDQWFSWVVQRRMGLLTWKGEELIYD